MSPMPDARARYDALLADVNLIRGGRVAPVWLGGGAQLAFLDYASAPPVLRIVDCASGREVLRRDLAALLGRPDTAPGHRELLAYREGELLLRAAASCFAVSGETGASRALSSEEQATLARAVPRVVRPGYPTILPPERETPGPDCAWFLTLAGYDAALRPSAGGEARQLTQDATPDFRWSTENARWSSCGRYLALSRMDEREVNRVPLVDWTSDIKAGVRWHSYPLVGGALIERQLHVIDTQTGAVQAIPGHDANCYSYILGFDTGGRELRYARMERRSKWVEIWAYAPASGEQRRLLRESADTFLYWPPTFFLFGPPIRFLASGEFVWLSEQSGWNQAYLYDADGKRSRQLTSGAYPVTDIAAFDERARRLYFRAQPDAARPYDVQLFALNLDGGETQQLSSASGIHELLLTPDGAHYLDLHSALGRPPCSELRNAGGELVSTLSMADTSGLQALGWTAPEQVMVKAADGVTDLNCVIYKPYDFDPAHRYPVIDSLYAGAQTIHALNSFSENIFRGQQAAAYAQLGYIVVMLDARGTPGRGKKFQDVVCGKLGDYEIADHVAALQALGKTRPWMDLERVGICGGSFGGYFTIRGLIQAPAFYKAGVAWTPAELGRHVFGIPVESYMGLPDDNPQLYARSLNSDKVERIRGELLMIGGSDDVNTPMAHFMLYGAAFLRAGKPVDQFIMPNHNHSFSDAGGDMKLKFFHSLVVRHFLRTLPPGERR